MDRYEDRPPLPDRIDRLRELALDLWWSWNRQARHVFRTLDYPLWRVTAHNPVRMLRVIPQETLVRAAADPAFQAAYDRAIADLDRARSAGHTWWARTFPDLSGHTIAYFSAEFALHQSLPIYAGGLGVLAGDHAKEASDLGVPLIGIGFMYPQGYFHQHVSAEGWQEESYEKLTWADAPIEALAGPDGAPCILQVPLGDRTVRVAVWRVRLGRVTLYLLDTDLEDNAPWDRELSARLYGGDREMRVQQEIILGIGGVGVLRALGLSRRRCTTSTRVMRPSSCCSAFASSSTRGTTSTRRSPRCGARPSSPPTRLCRPDTTHSRSIWSSGIWLVAGAPLANTARASWRWASTTTAAGRSST